MDNTSGFYKLDNTELLYSPNMVESANYLLIADLKLEYKFPIDGWYWFDSLEEAKTALQSV